MTPAERLTCVLCGREGHRSSQCPMQRHRGVFGSPKPQACMGGWCAKRDHCQHYHAEDRREPAERLCEPGHDGMPVTTQHDHITPWQMGPAASAAGDSPAHPGAQSNGGHFAASPGTRDESAYPRPITHATTTGAATA
jgi:hypothetical protein